MTINDAKKFCRERGNELRQLSDVLLAEALILDPSAMLAAAADCTAASGATRYEWSCACTDILFNAEQMNCRHTKPETVTVESLKLAVILLGRCVEDDDDDDPLQTLSVDIVVSGTSDARKRHRCAWHLDRHVFQPGDGASEDVHPCYHFQYGGRHIVASEEHDYGSFVMLEPPRIAHPPLDVVLAIDFVASNFFGQKWRALRDRPEYCRIIATAQNRLWRPYARSGAAIWPRNGIDQRWTAPSIWPQLGPITPCGVS